MPDITTRLGLKKPLSNESVARSAYNENLDIIDQNVATKNELDNLSTGMADLVKVKQNISILSTGWVNDTSSSGYWIHRIDDTKVTDKTIVDFAVHLEDLEKANNFEMQNLSKSFNGYYEFYAKSQPNEDIILDLKIINQVGEV